MKNKVQDYDVDNYGAFMKNVKQLFDKKLWYKISREDKKQIYSIVNKYTRERV